MIERRIKEKLGVASSVQTTRGDYNNEIPLIAADARVINLTKWERSKPRLGLIYAIFMACRRYTYCPAAFIT